MTSERRTHTSRIVFNLNDAEGGRRDVTEEGRRDVTEGGRRDATEGGRKGGVWGGGEEHIFK